ncbi:sigma-54 dependent transcriptional regulator [Candidatus Parabeggiatoa sp. HSG14]|uniref:sigma-54-dependent transcriptional regulator n=1 Tax=Candidatus Parabeggiatoa sp. HSG14 TaxID=3055593 RepID=UPI0025A7ED71|nr:sigma-54 dependent transcriptional regulator [Thiotrichales bacterium HSG14]
MSKPLCLIIDDEPDILKLSVRALKSENIDCCTAETFTQAQEYLQSQAFDVCLTDMCLPDGNGLDLVEIIGQKYPQTPVAVITAHGNVESAVQALKMGAFDFIAKPVKINQLRTLVKTALQLPKQNHHDSKPLFSDTKKTHQPVKQHEKLLSNLIGQSEAMQIVQTKIEKLARSEAPIYIKGESGTGKEVVAHLIHALGARAKSPFIPVNCGAIPAELMEGEFFGHKKGSFTGANIDKLGLFQAAEGGTLFLDEVADLPLAMQVKLLRAIQEKQVRPIGARKEVPVDIRILSATHRDLARLVKQGKFRQDLFYRINVIELSIPPLRERTDDIPDLINHILKRLISNTEETNDSQLAVSDKAMNALKEYVFPGNVRELENILERAITLCENNIIKPEDLQLPKRDNEPIFEYEANAPLDPLLDDVEKETILSALEQTRGNKTKAAQLLGIGFGALRYRLQKYKVEAK